MNKNDWCWVLRDERNDTTSLHYTYENVIGAGVLRLCKEFSSNHIPTGFVNVTVYPNEIQFREGNDKEPAKVHAERYKVQGV